VGLSRAQAAVPWAPPQGLCSARVSLLKRILAGTTLLGVVLSVTPSAEATESPIAKWWNHLGSRDNNAIVADLNKVGKTLHAGNQNVGYYCKVMVKDEKRAMYDPPAPNRHFQALWDGFLVDVAVTGNWCVEATETTGTTSYNDLVEAQNTYEDTVQWYTNKWSPALAKAGV
jgi:hypothetical protein